MKTIERKYFLPFVLVTSLFLLWGLAGNMTETLLCAFKKIMTMSDTETSFIESAFYGAYFVIALPAAIFIRKYSYKRGVVLGLILYATGAILFLPAAMAESYVFYLFAIYVMASGCSILETTANPYIMSMGSAETATRRLNIAQAFNPVGSIMGILISKYFILRDISLNSISETYAAVGVVLLFIMLVMIFSHMPEGRDTGVDDSLLSTFVRLFKNKKYSLGVIAQFFYVGAQIGVWSFTIRIVMQELGVVEADAATIYLITIIGFCLSRFIYTALMRWIRPTYLLIFGSMMSILATLGVIFGQGNGMGMVVPLILISFFMSLMFPTIYGEALGSIATSETPSDVKIGASGLIMAILGGAVMTPVQALVSDRTDIYTSYGIPLICFVVVLLYALYCSVRKSVK